MKSKGKITGLSLNWETKQPEVTMEIEANAEDVEALEGKDLSVEIKPYKKKRSIEANNYHWALCTQIGRKRNLSTAVVHNMLLRECAYVETLDGRTLYISLPDTLSVERSTLEAETFHLMPISQVLEGEDGVMYRTYALLRGSHDFNTEEMSYLIDRTIEMAKEQGIETMTENQKREMMAAYEQYHAGR